MGSLHTARESLGSLDGNIAIVAARFNETIVENLIKGAEKTFKQYGLKENQWTLYRVPGSFELPFFSQKVLQSGRYLGVLALGAVIRGETEHFEYVASAAAKGLMEVQLKMNLPIAFGVLTTDTLEQAVVRSDGDQYNKGGECALSLLEMIKVAEEISG